MALSKLISGALTSPTYRQSDLNRIFNLSDALVNALADGSINGHISATTSTPVGTYTKGDLIRNSQPVEITTSWGSYVVLGWICTDDSTTPGTFRDVRVLTGDVVGGGGISSGAPIGASYLTLGTDPFLTSERVLKASSPLLLTDGGAGATAVLSLATSIPSTGAPLTATYLTLSTDSQLQNERVLAVSAPLSLVDGGAGATAVLSLSTSIPSTGAPTSAQYLVLANDANLSAERVLAVASPLSLVDGGANGTATLSLSTSIPSTGAPISASYLVLGLDGQLTNERLLTVGTGLSLTDGGAGATAVLSASTIGAPKGAAYLTLGLDPDLTSERVLAVGYGLVLSDGGAGATATLSVSTSAISGAPSTSQFLVLATDTALSAERVLAAGTALSLTDNGAGQTASLSVSVDDYQLIMAVRIFQQ